MFGKKKANKTVDSRPASSDTSPSGESGALSAANNETKIESSGVANKNSVNTGPAVKTEKRTEPQLFSKPRTKDEPQMSSKPHSTSFRPEIPKRPLEIPTRGSSGRPASASHNSDGKS